MLSKTSATTPFCFKALAPTNSLINAIAAQKIGEDSSESIEQHGYLLRIPVIVIFSLALPPCEPAKQSPQGREDGGFVLFRGALTLRENSACPAGLRGVPHLHYKPRRPFLCENAVDHWLHLFLIGLRGEIIL